MMKMGFFADEAGYKWSNIAGVSILAGLLVLMFSVALFYEQPAPDVQVITINQTPTVTYYNYYTIDGEQAPLDLVGCKMLEMNGGGYALVCPK